jgi:rRNA maturation RNase YbeY
MNRAELSRRAPRTLARVLRAAQALGLAPARAQVSVSLVGTARMTTLNARYRGKRRPTDVLSFAPPREIGQATGFLGELVICADVLRRQAREVGHRPEQELLVLLVHGLLHLLGYDHERSASANRAMARLEARLLKKLGRAISPGLISRASFE